MATKYSFEVPIKHLEDFEDLQDFYFTLSILYKEKRYAEYMKRISREGTSAIWLDNSYNELMKAQSAITLSVIAEEYNAVRVIAPDSPEMSGPELTDGFFNLIDHDVRIENIICVASSQVIQEYLMQQGAINFALSYWVRPNLHEREISNMMPCHFLGLLSTNEILTFKPPSCDTSMPIKLALRNHDIDDWRRQGFPHINTKDLGLHGSDFFHCEMTPQQIALARINIKALKEVTRW